MKAINNSGGNGGHVIWNKVKTALTQRNILQFKGSLKVSDDSTDNATVIDDTPDQITFSDWNNMSTAQQDAYTQSHPKFQITNVPGTDGTISANLFTKLWENPSPTSAFAAQNITLASGDYDFLAIITNYCMYWFEKGQNCRMSVSQTSSSSSVTVVFRNVTYDSDVSLSIAAGYVQSSGSSRSVDNSILVPTAIYGIKKTISLKITAIAPTLSTSADHCMLSDGVTSVEDKIKEKCPQGIDWTNRQALVINTDFVVPSDGYVVVSCGRTNGNYVAFKIDGNTVAIMSYVTGMSSSTVLRQCISVYKGMTVKFEATSTTDGSSAVFTAFTYS